MNKNASIHFVTWGLTLAVFWLLLSGFLKPLLLGFGVFSVLLVLFLLRRMDATDGQPEKPAFGWPSLRYISWLIGQILLSSMEVTKLVWSKKKLAPAMAALPVSQVPEQHRVLYANSITLTPGTLSIDIDDQMVLVHALDEQSIAELQEGDMAAKIAHVLGDKQP